MRLERARVIATFHSCGCRSIQSKQREGSFRPATRVKTMTSRSPPWNVWTVPTRTRSSGLPVPRPSCCFKSVLWAAYGVTTPIVVSGGSCARRYSTHATVWAVSSGLRHDSPFGPRIARPVTSRQRMDRPVSARRPRISVSTVSSPP
jgi:hypothetical protein